MADGRHFENRYIAISQRKIIRLSWNFVHSSRFWTGWMSGDQKWKSCIGQTPSSTERISCYIYFFHYTLRLLRCCVSPVGCATVIILFVDNGECSFQRRSVDLLRSERANRFLSHFPLINCSCSTEKFADKIVSLIFWGGKCAMFWRSAGPADCPSSPLRASAGP